MCQSILKLAEMSRISNRAVSTIAASIGILLLVIFLVILWTGGVGSWNHTKVIHEEDTTRKDLVQGIKNSSLQSISVFHLIEEDHTEFNMTILDRTTVSFINEESTKDRLKGKKYNDTTPDVLPSAKGDLEYIVPMKISQNQYEDPPDPSTTSTRHHSGHFRHSTARVWDPHPQYEFTAFGKFFRLRLAHDSSFISPDIKVTHISANTSRKVHPGHQLDCFYSGYIDGDPDSIVTVNLCHGMTGHMRTSSGSYFIKPTEHWRENEKDSMMASSLQHAIYRVPPVTESTSSNDIDEDPPIGVRNCAVIDYNTDEIAAPVLLRDDNSGEKIYVGDRTRERRSLTVKTSMDRFKEDYDDDGGGGVSRSRKIRREENYAEEEFTQFVGHREHRNSLRDSRYYSVERRRNYPKEGYLQDSEMESDPFVAWRPQRALPREYFIEIMVVADEKMAEYHGENLDSYILVLMSTVSRIYKDRSIGNPVSIFVTKIVHADKVFGKSYDDNYEVTAIDMLNQFCRWQKINNPDEPSPEHHDVALLLTRHNLCLNPGGIRCDTLGLAELGKMCSPDASCAIVQDNGLAAAFTIAHEIGHVLNMPHDDDSKCDEFRNHSRVHKVMFRMLDDETFPWEWSRCSRHYVTEFLETDRANCLLDEPSKSIQKPDAARLPGIDYSQNKQCELVFGLGSKICHDMSVCRTLWCTVPMWDDLCHTEHTPWADGTSCGRGKWCQRGECVSKIDLNPIDGEWGPWGPFGECSRTCSGGIKKRYRECDNPPPQNGGNYCVGEQVNYESCATNECPPGSPDFREQQCQEYNNNNLNIPNLTRDVIWHAKYARIQPEDRCKLYCQVESNQYYMLRDKVIDGTPCGPDTFHLCVNGRCKPAGCDNILDSTAELDTCGVCRGDNSTCQRINGSYNKTAYGYNRVTKIPAGSSNIDIRQHGWFKSHYDDNYLALRLGEHGKYILNGNFVIMHKKVVVFPGVTIEYSGPKSIVERLNSSRPISTDLILEVLSVEMLHPPQITYEYTVPKKILKSYKWVLREWSECSRVCQGTKYRKAECRSTENEEVVNDDYCRAVDNRIKPREESQMCNNHCILQWQITSESECSSHCGPGTRIITSRCEQIYLYNSNLVHSLPDHLCSHLKRPNELEPCEGPCNDVHWKYSEWGACSVTCGGGIQYRMATCVDSNDRQVLNETCAGQKKRLKNICGQGACPKLIFGEWSKCSVSCGIGERHRLYWCHVENRVVQDSDCNGTLQQFSIKEICDAGPCYSWQVAGWNPCSVTCGEGVKTRKVICKGTDGSIADKCLPSNKPDNWTSCELQPCITGTNQIIYSNIPHEESYPQDNEIDSNGISFHPVNKWITGSFGKCSQPCNGGFKTRTVKCISMETNMYVNENLCNPDDKPNNTIPCNDHLCPIWNTGDWSECSVKCGNGIQRRQVRCQSPRGGVLNDKECSSVRRPKPKDTKKCHQSCRTTNNQGNQNNHHPKVIIRRWKKSGWSACSKTCGGGIRTRRIECMRSIGKNGLEKPVNEEECTKLAGLKKPKTERQCQRKPCNYGYIWQEGPWSECSAECGDGIKRRNVTCHKVNRYGWTDPEITKGCSMNKRLHTKETCKLRECNDTYIWKTSDWNNCTQSCGFKGKQTRKVFCVDRNGKLASSCPSSLKPKNKRNCNQRRCLPLTCVEAKKHFSTTKDGEYSLFIGGKSMSIYCYEMSTFKPREYLTLPAGDQDNYAEIYDKRLRYSETCPYNGERNDSCECFTYGRTISGITMFKRVRLDPIRLYIIADDYTFSRTKGLNRVEFGKAGDCYSTRYCPQGRFSINLSGTHLSLAREVTWTNLTSSTVLSINKINDQQVIGKCGGDCGFCIPKTGLKLDVLPP
ncbi:PREDICTED: A disintegrin and metalloproteinase with thrombospondin motifs 9 isoform X2 [Polistes dominula]|uniref:A disintegrin and metalloproteinase with thrombospondin motifs 9 isoform X2 n=1 Tax=Polistes dominula TaxID=743375 RepID=A0ABM1I9N7_POLDO|nr:PREDICTED: A disintegrin and metalloproteinase with thrombospondin motifs 9 isoform X2 [Polistes dominula]